MRIGYPWTSRREVANALQLAGDLRRYSLAWQTLTPARRAEAIAKARSFVAAARRVRLSPFTSHHLPA